MHSFKLRGFCFNALWLLLNPSDHVAVPQVMFKTTWVTLCSLRTFGSDESSFIVTIWFRPGNGQNPAMVLSGSAPSDAEPARHMRVFRVADMMPCTWVMMILWASSCATTLPVCFPAPGASSQHLKLSAAPVSFLFSLTSSAQPSYCCHFSEVPENISICESYC